MDTIVYDIETRHMPEEVGGWSKVAEMGIATCVTYSYNEQLYKFWGDTKEEHKKLLEYLDGNTAVGFNTINFDSKLLLGNDREILDDGTTQNKKYSFKNIDVFTEIWKQIFKTTNVNEAIKKQNEERKYHVAGVFNLDNISRNTLGPKCCKTTNGSTAPAKYQAGKIRELLAYNLQDTRVERYLYEFCKNTGYLVTGNFDIIRFEKEFSGF